MVEIGYISLLIGLALSSYAVAASLMGARRNYPELVNSARRAVYVVAGFLTLSTVALAYAFLSRDFSVSYVALYSSRGTSLAYTLAAFWAGSQGSLLFWSWALAIFVAIVAYQNRRGHRPLIPYVLAVTMATQAFFLLLLAFIHNPFERLPFPPPDGRGLNPLLENMGMLFHPPILILGYMGFTIPFAFAIAALATRKLGPEWLTSVRRWTLVAWLLLGVGNLLGMQWAYVELGWGGYYAWDPVENASFMPWLTATAFLHSAMIQKRRGMLKIWNMVLIIITFALTIFGTFITRSGVISSVHTFGESALGPFFTAFIAVSFLGSLGLLQSRLHDLKSDDELDSFVSRESSFLFNNLILVGSAFAILLGTVFPLISELVRGVKITVGPPYYNQVNAPIFLLLIVLMGICPLIGWRRASTANLIRNFLYPLCTALVLAAVIYILGLRKIYALVGLSSCAFVLATILLEWFRGVRARHRTAGENFFRAFLNLIGSNRPRYGGYIVHLGIILLAFGIIGSTAYKVEKEFSITPGQTMTIENYTLRYEGMSTYETATKGIVAANLTVYNNEKPVATMAPEKYFPRYYEQPVSEVAIRSNLLEDIYVILVGWERIGGVTAFKVLINPLVTWIWIGGVVLLVGGLVAVWPERKRQKRGPG